MPYLVNRQESKKIAKTEKDNFEWISQLSIISLFLIAFNN